MRRMRRSLRTLLTAASLALLLLPSACSASTVTPVATATQLEPDAATHRTRPVSPPPSVVNDGQWHHDWANGAVFYEIFVRSFADSNGDGIGDLKGLISKLDYLNDGNPATTTDLGVDAIWLMPIMVSPSYHGYDTVDYEHVNPQYGTDEDFVRLCQEAHRRGIRVIIDYVMNHSGSDHPWFVESASSPSSPKRDWYIWSATDRGWKQPWGGNYGTWHQKNGAWFYGVFWSGMPDLNFTNPAVREEMKRAANIWLQRGADGFRLDATRYLIETGGGQGQADTPETHAYLREFAKSVRENKPDAMLVGENWTDTSIIADYFGSTATVKGGDELPSSFNFPLAASIVDAVNRGDASNVAGVVEEMKRNYPNGVIDSPFLTNHDMVRLSTQLQNNDARNKAAAAILLTMPGSPYLYYGEEVGLDNGPTSGDESKRTPMPWNNASGGGFTTGSPWFNFAGGRDRDNVATQSADPSSLLSYYRKLVAARHSSEALMKGDLQMLTTSSGTNPVLAYVRRTANEEVLVVHNVSDSFVTAGPFDVRGTGMATIFKSDGVTDPGGTSGAWRVVLPGKATGVWRVKK